MTLNRYTLHENFLSKCDGTETKTLDVSMWLPPKMLGIQYSPDDVVETPGAPLDATELKQRQLEQTAKKLDEPKEHIDEISNKLPYAKDDSRVLLENKFPTSLELEDQNEIRSKFITLITEAVNDTERNKMQAYNDKRKIAYVLGVKEALLSAQKDMQEGFNLYTLVNKYAELSGKFKNVLDSEQDSEELNYPQSRHKGSASAYLNLSNILRDKLAEYELMKFKQNIKPSVR